MAPAARLAPLLLLLLLAAPAAAGCNRGDTKLMGSQCKKQCSARFDDSQGRCRIGKECGNALYTASCCRTDETDSCGLNRCYCDFDKINAGGIGAIAAIAALALLLLLCCCCTMLACARRRKGVANDETTGRIHDEEDAARADVLAAAPSRPAVRAPNAPTVDTPDVHAPDVHAPSVRAPNLSAPSAPSVAVGGVPRPPAADAYTTAPTTPTASLSGYSALKDVGEEPAPDAPRAAARATSPYIDLADSTGGGPARGL